MKAALPGYPLETRFASQEEIERYIGKHDIQCLLCGHRMRRISGSHLEGHGVTDQEYRERFGLPENTPLCCADTSQRNAMGMLRSHEVMRQANAADRSSGYTVSAAPRGEPSQERRAQQRSMYGRQHPMSKEDLVAKLQPLIQRLSANAPTQADRDLLARVFRAYLANPGRFSIEHSLADGLSDDTATEGE